MKNKKEKNVEDKILSYILHYARMLLEAFDLFSMKMNVIGDENENSIKRKEK